MLTQQGTQTLSPQLTLLVPREQAATELDKQLERGTDIRNQRIRARDELDSARQLKKEWVRRNNELFERLFSETSILEQYASVTATILPEFADLELFIEQFYEEMDQRLHRLKTIRRMVESVPEMVRRRIPRPVYTYEETEVAGVTMDRPAAAPAHAAAATMTAPTPQAPAPPEGPTATPAVAPAAPAPAASLNHVAQTAPVQEIQPEPQPVQHAPQPAPQVPPLQPNPVQVAPAPAPTPTPASAPVAPQPPAAAPESPPAPPASKPSHRPRTVIILHGDSESRQAVCDFLQRLDLKPQVFNGGLMECRQDLEQLNGQAAFALLLLPEMPDRALIDDEDQPASAEGRSLLLELGYCAGRFGRGRTCALFPGSAAPSTDELGTSYLPLDSAGGWQLALARQIRQAGLEVDLNRIC